jgi:serine/threonine protein kinase
MEEARFAFGCNLFFTIFLDMCMGLNYLHAMDIIHRDLNMGNFLITSDFIVKISDFGESRRASRGSSSSLTAGVGASLFRAPEVYTNEYDSKCDVWSTAIVLSQIAQTSRTIVLPSFPPNTKGVAWFGDAVTRENREAVENLLFDLTKDQSKACAYNRQFTINSLVDELAIFAPIIMNCISLLPADRPSFHQNIIRLTGLQELYMLKIVRQLPPFESSRCIIA